MSVVTNRPSANRIILRNVGWETYERLLKDLENSSSPRLAFDQGRLEIMSPHLDHEETNRTLASLVEMALEEMDLDFRNAGSTTFKREVLKRGFEPDPPPDLLIEIDLTNDSLNKFPLYAVLGVREVWRYEKVLEIWMLDQSRYIRRATSAAVPIFTDKLVSELLLASFTMKRPAWLRQTRKRIRALIP